MKVRVLTICLNAITCLFIGCQPGTVHEKKVGGYEGIAGTWKADGSLKAIEIDKQGKLVSITNEAGLKILTSEGGISQANPDGSATLHLILGTTPVAYNPESNTLKVTINYDEYRIESAGGRVTGKMQEVLTGKVNVDEGTWSAESATETSIDGMPAATDTKRERYLFRKS